MDWGAGFNNFEELLEGKGMEGFVLGGGDKMGHLVGFLVVAVFLLEGEGGGIIIFCHGLVWSQV